MLLRSSSTPVLGSLLQSHHESPNNQHPDLIISSSKQLLSSPSSFHPLNKPPVHHRTIYSSRNPISSRRSSSFSPSAYEGIGSSSHINGVRRAQSDGNLEGLIASCEAGYDELNDAVADSTFSKKMNHRSSRPHCLQTIPSFSFHNSRRVFVDEEEYTDDDEENELDRYIGGGDCSSGGGGGGDWKLTGHDEDGPHGDVEEHYKKMVEQDPRNPLLLRNYAQFLYQVKKDLTGAEEYYSRAILEDPTDGDILSNYAKINWELHRDQQRAETYFERAVQASPEDSHVLAAHASFLWEIEEEEEEVDRIMVENDFDRLNPFLCVATIKG